jgi:hypothetical protein
MTVVRREDVQSARELGRTSVSHSSAADPHNRASDHPPSSRSVTGPRYVLRRAVGRVRYGAVAGSGCRAAQRNPASSRAMATAICGVGLCAAASFRKRSTQPLLRFVGDRNHPAGLPPAATGERGPDCGPVLIVPRRFHQHPTHQRVARARDAAAPMCFAARVLAGHEPHIGHQRARRRKPAEVMQLRQNNEHRRQRIDAAEASQSTDRGLIRFARSGLNQPGIQLQQPRLGVIDGQQIVVDTARSAACVHSRLSIHCRCPRVQFLRPDNAGRGAAATCRAGDDTAADLHGHHRALGTSREQPPPPASAVERSSTTPHVRVPPACGHRGFVTRLPAGNQRGRDDLTTHAGGRHLRCNA